MRRLFIITAVCLLCYACGKRPTDSLKIAAAASMQFAIDSLVNDFQVQTGISCESVFSSSGTLCAQLLNGAPYDLFISADSIYTGKLHYAKVTRSAPETFAYGRLVLWTLNPGILPDTSVLRSSEVSYIAVANPGIAPYGRAAEEVLVKLGYFQDIKSKLVFGESISAVNRLVYSGAADLGFTAKSLVNSPSFREVGRHTDLDPILYTPLGQTVVVMNNTSKPEEAEKFRDYLLSDRAGEILEVFGYEKRQNEESNH